MSKRLVAGILLSLSMLPFLVVIVFVARQQVVRSQMEEQLKESRLVSITIQQKNFRWYKKGKEIKVSGHLFDVESIQVIKPGVLLVKGLYDYQEQDMYENLENWLKEDEDGKNKQHQIAFVKWVNSLYWENYISYQIPAATPVSNEHFLSNIAEPNSRFSEVQIPPPKRFFS